MARMSRRTRDVRTAATEVVELSDLIRADLGMETALRVTDTLASSRYGKDVSDAEVRAIMSTQLSRTARLARADDVIDNGGPREALREQVLRLHDAYRQRAALEPAGRSPENGAQTRVGTDPT